MVLGEALEPKPGPQEALRDPKTAKQKNQNDKIQEIKFSECQWAPQLDIGPAITAAAGCRGARGGARAEHTQRICGLTSGSVGIPSPSGNPYDLLGVGEGSPQKSYKLVGLVDDTPALEMPLDTKTRWCKPWCGEWGFTEPRSLTWVQ